MHFFKFKIRWTLIDLNQIFPMKPLEFEISLSIISFDKKNCRKLLTFLGCRKAPNYQRYRSQISVAQFYDFNQKISKCLRPYLQNFQKYQQLKKTGSGWFILSPMCHCRRGFPLLRSQLLASYSLGTFQERVLSKLNKRYEFPRVLWRGK